MTASAPEFGYGTVAGGSVIAALLDVSTRSAHLPGWAPDVFGSVSFLYCTVALTKWFGLMLLISPSPSASPSAVRPACTTFAVAFHEPAGACCSSNWALPFAAYRSACRSGTTRRPLATVGAAPEIGFTSAHFGSTVVPVNSSVCGQPAVPPQSSPGVCGSLPETTLNASNCTVSSGAPSCLANTPTRRPPAWDRYCVTEIGAPNDANVVPLAELQVVTCLVASS